MALELKIEEAEKLYCHRMVFLENNLRGKYLVTCQTIDCMAWVKDGEKKGHCKLLT